MADFYCNPSCPVEASCLIEFFQHSPGYPPQDGYLSGEDLSALLQIPDDELLL